MSITLCPGVHEMKNSIICPNPRAKFFINANALGSAISLLKPLCGFMEFTVLSRLTRREVTSLI
jgi:hypothetical protein